MQSCFPYNAGWAIGFAAFAAQRRKNAALLYFEILYEQGSRGTDYGQAVIGIGLQRNSAELLMFYRGCS